MPAPVVRAEAGQCTDVLHEDRAGGAGTCWRVHDIVQHFECGAGPLIAGRIREFLELELLEEAAGRAECEAAYILRSTRLGEFRIHKDGRQILRSGIPEPSGKPRLVSDHVFTELASTVG